MFLTKLDVIRHIHRVFNQIKESFLLYFYILQKNIYFYHIKEHKACLNLIFSTVISVFMNIKKQQLFPGILLILLLIGTFILAYGYLRPGHQMMGDFALYLRQIQAIWQSDGQQVYDDMAFMLSNSSNDVYSPILYPWGFSILMAPFYPFFGLDHLSYKIVIAVYFTTAIAMIYLTFKNKEDFRWQALSIAALIAIQPKYLSWMNMVLSEIPYLFFVMLSMYTLNRIYSDKQITPSKIPAYIGLGILLMFTAQVRTEGILLFPALAVSHLYYLYRNPGQWMSWKKAPRFFLVVATPYLAGFIFFIALSLIFPSGFLKHTDHFEFTSTIRVLANTIGYIRSFQQFPLLSAGWALTLFLLVTLWGIFERFPKDLPETAFLLFSFALLLIWPHQNTRHLFALLPFMLYFFAQGLASIPLRLFKLQWSVYVLLALFLWLLPGTIRSSVKNYRANNRHQPYGTDSQSAQEMFEYLKKHTSPEDIVGYAHARTLYLYTGRKTIAIWGNTEMFWTPADWYVWGIHGGSFMQYSKEILKEYGEEITETFRNKDYVVYKINKNGHE